MGKNEAKMGGAMKVKPHPRWGFNGCHGGSDREASAEEKKGGGSKLQNDTDEFISASFSYKPHSRKQIALTPK